MPTKSAKGAMKTPTTSRPTARVNPAQPVDRFPLAQYASVLGVHLLLVAFTALYLPQTTRLFAPLAARETDRPLTEFMARLTMDPALTLGWISVGLIPLQVWWASWVREWYFEQTAKESEVETKLERVRFDGLRLTKLKGATAFTLCGTLAIHVVLVVFGAPIATHILQTTLLAFVIAILTAFTPAFALGPPSLAPDTPSLLNRLTWTRLFAELTPKNSIEYVMVYPTVGTFVGSWLGAMPVALDWDRPWQSWPLTPLFGSLGGYSIGSCLAFAFITAKWIAADHIRSEQSKLKSS